MLDEDKRFFNPYRAWLKFWQLQEFTVGDNSTSLSS